MDFGFGRGRFTQNFRTKQQSATKSGNNDESKNYVPLSKCSITWTQEFLVLDRILLTILKRHLIISLMMDQRCDGKKLLWNKYLCHTDQWSPICANYSRRNKVFPEGQLKIGLSSRSRFDHNLKTTVKMTHFRL